MSKGFFSAAINALVIGAVVTAALFALTYAASYDASVKGLEAKRVADRAYDGNHSSRQVALDSLMDSAFAVYGCSPSPADFCTVANNNYTSYLSNYSSALNDSLVNFNSSILGIYCNSTTPTGDFNWSFTYAANTSFAANSPNAKKTLLDSFSWTLGIRNYTPAVVNGSGTLCSGEVLMKIAVNDSSGSLLDYDVNCSQAPINLPGGCPP